MDRKPRRRNVTVMVLSMLGASLLARALLFIVPQAGGGIAGIHVHHLLIGVLLMGIGGIPTIVTRSARPGRVGEVGLFGFGLGLALDEWVLLVIRESNPAEPYQSASSVIGALTLLALAAAYAVLVDLVLRHPAHS